MSLLLLVLAGCHTASVKLGGDETGLTDGGDDSGSGGGSGSAGDTGATDTGSGDTDSSDTGSGATDSSDSGTDTSASDTGPTDSGTGDTGPTDSGTGDTGPTEASCLDYGAVLDAMIDLETAGSVDSFNGSSGDWSSSRSRDSAAVAVNGTSACVANVNASTLHGSVWTGPGSDPASATCVTWGGSITGSVATLTSAVALPLVSPPTGLPSSEGPLTVEWSAHESLTGVHTLDALTLQTSGQLDVSGDTTLYVSGDVYIGGATLSVAAGAHLDLYVTGSLTVEWSGRLESDDGASAVTVHMLGSSPISLATSGSMEALVLAPAADVVVNSGRLEGALAARSLTVDWSGAFHQDDRLLCGG